MTTAATVIRQATATDRPALARLASLDSNAIPAGTVLLAEQNGEIRAATSIHTGDTIADPFHHTAELVSLLHHTRGSDSHTPRSARVNALRRILTGRQTSTQLAYS